MTSDDIMQILRGDVKGGIVVPPGASAPPGVETQSMAIFELLDYIVNEVRIGYLLLFFFCATPKPGGTLITP